MNWTVILHYAGSIGMRAFLLAGFVFFVALAKFKSEYCCTDKFIEDLTSLDDLSDYPKILLVFLAGRIIVKRARRFIDMCEGVLEVERD
jgi:hypothetical protein